MILVLEKNLNKFYILGNIIFQNELNKIVYSLVVNPSSREATLVYISKMLLYNEKRCKMRVEEQTIAGDGFMLNILSALQELSVKVIVEILIKFYQYF